MSRLTKNAITSSLIKLMASVPLDKITVKDIVDDCDISRNTFYYNYQDIYAVIEELFSDEINRAVNNCDADSWQHSLRDICAFLNKNRSIVYNLYNSSKRSFFKSMLYDFIDSRVLAAVSAAANGLNVSENDKGFVYDFYRFAAHGLVKQWIDSDMKASPDKLADEAMRIMDGSVRSALEKSTGTNP